MNRAPTVSVAILALACAPLALAFSPDPAPGEEPRVAVSARELGRDLSRQASSISWSRRDSADIVSELIVIDTLAAALGDEGWAARHNVVRGLAPFVNDYIAAKERLILIRQDTGAVFAANRAPPGSDGAWIDSNIALGGVRNVLEWVQSRCGAPQDRLALGREARRVLEVLIDNGRYDLMECVPRSLLSHAEVSIKVATRMLQPPDEPADAQLAGARRNSHSELTRRVTIEGTSHTVGALHAAALVSGQPEIAQRIADMLLADLDHPESKIALATHAQRAGVADERHDLWMREGVAKRDQERAARPERDPFRLPFDLEPIPAGANEQERGRLVTEPPY